MCACRSDPLFTEPSTPPGLGGGSVWDVRAGHALFRDKRIA